MLATLNIDEIVPKEPGRSRKAFNARQHGPRLTHAPGEHCPSSEGHVCYVCELYICANCGAAEMEVELAPCDPEIVLAMRAER